jgi:hypothetical protein
MRSQLYKARQRANRQVQGRHTKGEKSLPCVPVGQPLGSSPGAQTASLLSHLPRTTVLCPPPSSAAKHICSCLLQRAILPPSPCFCSSYVPCWRYSLLTCRPLRRLGFRVTSLTQHPQSTPQLKGPIFFILHLWSLVLLGQHSSFCAIPAISTKNLTGITNYMVCWKCVQNCAYVAMVSAITLWVWWLDSESSPIKGGDEDVEVKNNTKGVGFWGHCCGNGNSVLSLDRVVIQALACQLHSLLIQSWAEAGLVSAPACPGWACHIVKHALTMLEKVLDRMLKEKICMLGVTESRMWWFWPGVDEPSKK